MALMMDKRGNLLDIFYIMAVLVAVSIFLVVTYHVFGAIKPELDSNLNDPKVTTLTQQTQDALSFFDIVFPVFFLGLILATLISAYFIKSHPAFFFVSLFIWVIAIIVAVPLANMHSELRDNSSLSTSFAAFPISNTIINNMPIIALVISALVAAVLFAKPGGNEQAI